MKILFVGSALIDVVAKMRSPEEVLLSGEIPEKLVCAKLGSKTELDDIGIRFGGSAANSAITAKQVGCEAKILAAVGDDEFGRLIENDLRRHGITERTVKLSGERTGVSVVLLANGEKAALPFRGANAALDASHVKQSNVAWCDVLFITSLTSHKNVSAFKKLVSLAHAMKKKIVFAPSISMLKARLKEVRALHENFDLIIMNEEEASAYTGEAKLEKMLAELPGKARVITLGEKGAIAMERGRVFRVKARKMRVIDATGAGDAFSGAFAAKYFSGSGVKAALEYATKVAALKLRHVGAHLPASKISV